jgi:hypothetical protein
MCLSVSRLFWVSSLAYPNLLGTKGYVVVVIVVVVDMTYCEVLFSTKQTKECKAVQLCLQTSWSSLQTNGARILQIGNS